MTDAEELARLQALLRARTNGDDPKPGYRRNVQMLRQRISALEYIIAAKENLPPEELGNTLAKDLLTHHPEPQHEPLDQSE